MKSNVVEDQPGGTHDHDFPVGRGTGSQLTAGCLPRE
jgi:hypothetical protein